VKMNTFITDMDNAPAVREVRARYFGDTTPASTLVQVVHLARPELMLEIEVIAVVPAQ
jgi:enamine deaminase RidA (YjgF/YER057c/UK114 family)